MIKYGFPKKIKAKRPPAFTLLEILMAMGLFMVVYSLISSTTVQMSRTVRVAEEKFAAKKSILDAAELMRWQLRTLYYESTGAKRGGRVSLADVPTTNTHPGTLGNYSIYGARSSQSGQDVLIFRTTTLLKKFPDAVKATTAANNYTLPRQEQLSVLQGTSKFGGGTVEVGYRILNDDTNGSYLAYRQYPWVDPLGLHPENEDPNAPWRILCKDIKNMQLEFSDDGEIWQKEWSSISKPKWIRVALAPVSGQPFVLVVSPGVGSERW